MPGNTIEKMSTTNMIVSKLLRISPFQPMFFPVAHSGEQEQVYQDVAVPSLNPFYLPQLTLLQQPGLWWPMTVTAMCLPEDLQFLFDRA